MKRAASNAHFLDDVGQRLELPGPGGHGHLRPVLKEVHKLDEHHVQIVRLAAHRLHSRPHSGHVTVMIRAPDVHDPVEAAAVLVVMIGDIGGEVGERTVRLFQDAVLVVTEIRGAEPQRAVLFKGQARFPQPPECFLHRPAFDQRTLGKPHLMLHTELAQVRLDAVKNRAHPVGEASILPFGIGQRKEIRFLFHHLACYINDIAAAVVIFRPIDGHPRQFLGPQPDGQAEQTHLASGVVDVIFRGHIVSSETQDARQRIAYGRAAPMPDMQGPGGVGGNVFHLHLAASARRRAPEVFPARVHAPHHVLPENQD